MVGDDVAVLDLGQRAPKFAHRGDDLLLGAEHFGGVGNRARFETIGGGVELGTVLAPHDDLAEGELRSWLDGKDHRNGFVRLEVCVGREGFKRTTGKAHLHHAAEPGILVERADQLLEVRTGARDQSDGSGNGLFFPPLERGGRFELLAKIGIPAALDIESDRVVERIDDWCFVFFLLEKLEAEDLDCLRGRI